MMALVLQNLHVKLLVEIVCQTGKVTCATSLYQQDFGDQLIKERTGHRSLEAIHKYKRTGSDQQHRVSMALLPPVAKKENIPPTAPIPSCDDDDDLIPLKKSYTCF